jgi:NodT family efflux transporter outer membrane factor (OMF) lipoprotein
MGTDRSLRARPLLAVVAGAMLCAGCTVGPGFRRPETKSPDAWVGPSIEQAAGADAVASRPVARAFDGRHWWSVFNDPLLDRLVDEAAGQNIDLQTALSRIAEARAQRDSAAGAELPTIAGNGVAGRQRMSETGIASTLGGGGGGGGGSGGSQPSTISNLFQVGFDATWELDLWGKTRRNVEAATASIESAEQQRGDAVVSTTAEIARNYLQLRGLQRQRAVVLRDIADQRRLLQLIGSRAERGFVPRSDATQQDAQLAAAEAQLPGLEQSTEAAANRLALLLALPPNALRERLGDAPGEASMLPPEVPIGLPGELLRRRPDVLRSEAELHAATARVGVSESALFPSIQLGAAAGLQSTSAGSLSDWASRFILGGTLISVPIFQGGQLRAQVHVADAQMQQAALGYRKTVLSAYHDANDAIVAYVQEQRHARALARQVALSRQSRDQAQARYRSGLSPLAEVLQIDRTTHQAELAALQSTLTASTNLVALYKALGGDWQGDVSARP